MLQLTARLFETPPVLASLQGPNQFFLGAANGEVGYGWITSRRPAESIRLHHDMVLHVADEAGRQFAIPRSRRLLVGFSQSVGLNYRFAATHPDAIRGVIGVCGGLPGDWDDGLYLPVNAAVLHIARSGVAAIQPGGNGCLVVPLEPLIASVTFSTVKQRVLLRLRSGRSYRSTR